MMKVLLLMVLLVTKARLGQSDWGTRESEGGSVGGEGGGGGCPNWAFFFPAPFTTLTFGQI